MNYNSSKFNRLVKYCEEKLASKIVVIRHPYLDGPDGHLVYEGTEALYIEIFIPKLKPDWNCCAAVLIHEVCHQQLIFRPHSEFEVWQLGRTLFPPNLIPDGYSKYRNRFISTYGDEAKVRKR